ncbi:MAG: ribosomal RNA small subunit methyltransferase A [Leptospiraceae bacterium]|nr:ribosomal RNA small subunit methyltransferase A [Leptospiraceae bacterium]MCP5512772.1 ribosomal RNA small subunit methyltransferase A [Leptospiraceae bacterium]
MSYLFFSPKKIRTYLEEKKAAPLKKWGQNFLIDRNIARMIIESPPKETIDSVDSLIEIGPGLGALTHMLLTMNKPLSVFEIDPVMIETLIHTPEFQLESFRIFEGDVLENLQKISDQTFYCFGNLPYYISSEILSTLMKTCPNCKGGVFLLQKEFAERISGEHSSLSVFLGAFGNWKILKHIKGSSFYPPPKAVSSVLQYTPLVTPKISVRNVPYLEKILRGFFWGKRKTMDRILIDSPFLQEEKEILKDIIFSNDQFSGRERVSEIPGESFYLWAETLGERMAR